MSTVKDKIRAVSEGEVLCARRSEELFDAVFSGAVSEIELSAVLTAMKVRGEAPEEIAGAARSMRKAATPLTIGKNGHIDTCGTGGDHSFSFNISSAAAIVISAAGIPVAKHGNRSVSSRSGSADFLEALRIPIGFTGEAARDYYHEHGFVFMFAPNYHPAMKYAAPVRKALSVRTIFNYLGPITNPAFPKKQMIGVFSRNFLEKYARVVAGMGYERALIYSSEDGMDEVSPSAPTLVYEIEGGRISNFTINPGEFISPEEAASLPHHCTAAENASLFMEAISSPVPTALGKFIALNAALAMYTHGKGDIARHYHRALEIVHGGAAREKVNSLRGPV